MNDIVNVEYIMNTHNNTENSGQLYRSYHILFIDRTKS